MDKDNEDHIEDMLNSLFDDCEVDTFYYDNLENLYEKLALTVEYQINDCIETTDSLLYFAPTLFTGQEENPFVSDKRLFDIEYSYEIFLLEQFNINVPGNYTVTEVPKYVRNSLKEFFFDQTYTFNGAKLSCVRHEILKDKLINKKDYDTLKSIYEDMVLTNQLQIVLKNNNIELGKE